MSVGLCQASRLAGLDDFLQAGDLRDVHTWQSAGGGYWTSYGVPLAARYLAC